MSHMDTEVRPSNFIRNIIDEDIAAGKHATVHTRFPPEPNGYLHIGHAKSICLNFGLAQDYKGLCNLRFDDTNPEKEDIDYVNSIQEDVKWLGFNWDGDICYSSNYFDRLHGYAVELIEKGLAYVCFLNGEQTREYRGTLKEPGKTVLIATLALRRTWRCLTKCVKASSKRANARYVQSRYGIAIYVHARSNYLSHSLCSPSPNW